MSNNYWMKRICPQDATVDDWEQLWDSLSAELEKEVGPPEHPIVAKAIVMALAAFNVGLAEGCIEGRAKFTRKKAVPQGVVLYDRYFELLDSGMKKGEVVRKIAIEYGVTGPRVYASLVLEFTDLDAMRKAVLEYRDRRKNGLLGGPWPD